MGYMSDTAIVLPFEVYTRGLQWMTDNSISDNDNMLKWYDYIKMFTNGDILLLYDYLKWYEEFPEISALEEFLNTLDEDEYQYVRMGEEFEDNTFRGGYTGQYVWISRSFDIEDLESCVNYKPDRYYIPVDLSFNDSYKFHKMMMENN